MKLKVQEMLNIQKQKDLEFMSEVVVENLNVEDIKLCLFDCLGSLNKKLLNYGYSECFRSEMVNILVEASRFALMLNYLSEPYEKEPDCINNVINYYSSNTFSELYSLCLTKPHYSIYTLITIAYKLNIDFEEIYSLYIAKSKDI